MLLFHVSMFVILGTLFCVFACGFWFALLSLYTKSLAIVNSPAYGSCICLYVSLLVDSRIPPILCSNNSQHPEL